MQVSVLASGSTGNTSLIETGQHKILMDAGLSGKKIKMLLSEVAFATSHDAAQPQYYVFTSGGKRMAFLTDTGYVSRKVKSVIADADAYLMEFNYDDMMLRNGPYSWGLKQRILSDVGHLSNDDAGQALLDVVTSKTEHIFLAHRSQHNNTAKLAYNAAKKIMVDGDANLPSDVKIVLTDPVQPTNLVQI